MWLARTLASGTLPSVLQRVSRPSVLARRRLRARGASDTRIVSNGKNVTCTWTRCRRAERPRTRGRCAARSAAVAFAHARKRAAVVSALIKQLVARNPRVGLPGLFLFLLLSFLFCALTAELKFPKLKMGGLPACCCCRRCRRQLPWLLLPPRPPPPHHVGDVGNDVSKPVLQKYHETRQI